MEKQSGVMALPQTMYGVQLIGHGGPDQLVWNETIPVPLPRPGEVLARVLAAGVNNTDINTRIGWYSKDVTVATADVGDEEIDSGGWAGALPFPLIQGGDLCGEVVLLGKGVTEFKPGMRVTCPINQPNPTEDAPRRFEVLGSDLDGTFAQFCKVPARQLFDVSSSPLSDIEIGAMPCAYGTALTLLTRSRVGAQDRVLITGASGGVGLAAVQLAKLKGAKVTGMSSPAKADSVLAAGAVAVIGRDQTPTVQAFTVVIDVVGGSRFGALLEALIPGGRYATAGAIAGPIVETDLRTVYLQDLTIFGCTYQPKEVFADLISLINRGSVRPLISKTYSLRDIATAQEDFACKRYPGKLVLLP
ncbi:MAG: zinc-binding dehydrogenase [Arenicellales bacterium]|jgi:alcohol dehydrogenase|nr:zinc-binding dehydrogenase [Arenicellales bacterium]MDP6313647.1 zinc-binding dehydrogenase [Arenicellales bacterium]MDP7119758.1 zinc-binding dehydrogenase [Arenicellales bacterium]MDP7193481.1 zinc-binding dehydrogenase [Arenicellales bacterium]MDP7490634.1 zinc-binding dehydrogenase [Arenicellales bacterium]